MCGQPPVFELIDVSHRFGRRLAVRHVSWQVARGEHWAVLGPNGAGKTTLLRIVAGYLWPNAGGEVRRDGQSLADLGELRKSIGWVTARLLGQIPPAERVLDTVVSGRFAQIGLLPYRGIVIRQSDRQRARQYLDQLQAGELAAGRFGELSQGEQQKVLIARARMARPLVLILDDPCAGLDLGAREILLASLAHLADQAAAPSLVLVTHHLEEIIPALGQTLVVHEGRVVACGATDQVLNEALVQRLYDLPLRIERRGGRLWPLVDRP